MYKDLREFIELVDRLGALRRIEGAPAHQRDATAVAAQKAVAAISVVTMPACASTGGIVVKIRVAATAAAPPPAFHPQKKTAAEAIQKSGRTPRRASVSMRS